MEQEKLYTESGRTYIRLWEPISHEMIFPKSQDTFDEFVSYFEKKYNTPLYTYEEGSDNINFCVDYTAINNTRYFYMKNDIMEYLYNCCAKSHWIWSIFS